MTTTIVEKLRKQIESFDSAPTPEGIGTVVSVGDGVAEIDGLPNALMAEMLEFDISSDASLADSIGDTDRVFGMVLNLEEHAVRVVVLGDTRRVKEGMTVRSSGRVLSVPVGEALIGRVVNTLGEPIDGKGPIKEEKMYPVERPAHPVIERAPVKQPLHTGLKAVDSMIPIGRGQRELIIGDRFTGKTTIAVDTILNQINEPEATRPICIYVAIGQKESKTARIVAKLKDAGAMDFTIVVDAPASDPAALQFLAPYAGVTMGEYFMEKGKDVLVIYDDLSKQSVAYREVSLLLRRPPGREAFPGDIFYLHSRLLERSAKLSKELGGGSITALPIIETQEGDVSAYIPTNVISITDGQIFLETDLFNKGVRPAINVGLSVSRVGSSAQTKAMKSVAGKMRIELAQYRELEAFAQFSGDLDEDTKKRLDKGARLVEVLKQPHSSPLGVEKQVAIIVAANEGFFKTVSVEQTAEVSVKLATFLENQYAETLAKIRASGEVSDETKASLVKAYEQFTNAHPEHFTV
ncbi:TPA: F0F1 ATP synthase subunit alpha [Patescibacteria group bacterium]|nr:MAG: ATP synthase subunit alpha [Parcubacteria group bacterium GW2011_GWD2_42_14]HCC05207.1 F0F1 ATP synthase subunit alpha [Patescibacteria group bacterium]